MINLELARAFERIADLLEINEADRFRINSYRRAARTLEDTADDIADLAAEGRLTELPGIGKGTAGRIQQFIDTGRIDVLAELEAQLPPPARSAGNSRAGTQKSRPGPPGTRGNRN